LIHAFGFLCGYFSGKSVVHVCDIHGNAVGTFGRFGKHIGEFNEPSGITKDSSGMLLIADSRNNRIQVGHSLLYVDRTCVMV